MDTNFIEELLQKESENEEKSNQRVRVEKPIELSFDLRHLLAVDTNELDVKAFRFSIKCLIVLIIITFNLIIFSIEIKKSCI